MNAVFKTQKIIMMIILKRSLFIYLFFKKMNYFETKLEEHSIRKIYIPLIIMKFKVNNICSVTENPETINLCDLYTISTVEPLQH